ncbi:heterokaryon incompatibility protein-domain-containing protein [Alternaria rosae]|uniref:heterokaryon incompatibility protein-domain-containing protein n=1 Tax=Alternaria rosae TaxID=1187941 RepID=UPI001E8E3866|nr:heterokaryon incompatibility protein-domain-containing protein [Alternaria rosae]KAH6870171.1 heterokaryon incompatibility protein-domain-containing protein [Alternaria rosae]
MGTVEFQYTTGDNYKTLKPDLTIYDEMATPRRLKTQYAPRRIYFKLAKTWVAACKESHPACTTHFSRELKGLRVIDCVTRNVAAAPKDCIYVALSYVWGMSGICDDPSSYTLPERLPLSVENSIDATLMLGYRYLWVDRYCIDQMNAADKHHQINQMGDIYSSAELTLIAAAGANSAHGLPGVVSERERFEHDVAIGRLRFVTTYGWAIDEIYRSVWSSRAWTFQEGYISRRRLYFTDTRLVYICETEVYCDAEWGCMPTGRESLAHLAECLPSIYSKMGLAAGILREYTRRNLTFNSDALNAIVGILNTLSKGRTPIFHTWGVTFGKIPIPKTVAQNRIGVPLIKTQNVLAIALHWIHTSPCHRRKAFPSWSPLGWEG